MESLNNKKGGVALAIKKIANRRFLFVLFEHMYYKIGVNSFILSKKG